MLLQAINGNGNAISQLATTFYTDEILEELELIGCS
jgi:hypothetical protein